MPEALQNYWIRIYVNADDIGYFEYHGPWWESGAAGDGSFAIVCLAVRARDEDHAKAIVLAAFDAGHAPRDFSFVDRQAVTWSPFCDRFRRKAWMQWPEVTRLNEKASSECLAYAYGGPHA